MFGKTRPHLTQWNLENRRGKSLSAEHRSNMRGPRQPFTEEHKRKMSQSMRGKKHEMSAEGIQAIRESLAARRKHAS